MTPPHQDSNSPSAQSFENALLLREHSVTLANIDRRLGNIERALWWVVASVALGFVTAVVTWVVNGGLVK